MGTELSKVDERPAPVMGTRGIEIKSIDDLARLATMAAKSGLAAKRFNSAEACGVAIAMGIELGFSPMQSLNSVVVINGRPGLDGAAALALVRSSGLLLEFQEFYELGGKRVDALPDRPPDDACAVCTVRRKGCTTETTRFSVQDAKRAKLWGKAGPWTEYYQRMLMFRARGFRLNDTFSDILKGLKTVEELQDYPDDSRRANMPPPAPVQVQAAADAPAVKPEAPQTLQEGMAAQTSRKCQPVEIDTLRALAGELRLTKVQWQESLAHRGVTSLSKMTAEQCEAVATDFRRELVAGLLTKLGLNLDDVRLDRPSVTADTANLLTPEESVEALSALRARAASTFQGGPEPTEAELATVGDAAE